MYYHGVGEATSTLSHLSRALYQESCPAVLEAHRQPPAPGFGLKKDREFVICACTYKNNNIVCQSSCQGQDSVSPVFHNFQYGLRVGLRKN